MKLIRSRKSQEGGFALVSTISILVMLALIAVGLLSLSSVTIRSATRSTGKAIAEANARLALMLAIGDLQRELGPDARISASYDTGDVSGGSAQWTAVYDSWQGLRGGRESPESRGEPKFRGWLVSGASAPGDGPISGTGENVELVGAGTLGGVSDPNLRVEVPLIEVSGLSNSGQMGWWVADEGMKAKINAGPNDEGASSFGRSDPIFHSQSPPHPGHQVIPPLADFEWSDGERSRVVSKATVPVATGVDDKELGEFTHDFTVHSAGLLTDVRTGGLRRDLSNLLSRPIEQLEDKPLYQADGRMNVFNISEAGAVVNGSGIGNSWQNGKDGPKQWGINLEELHLFHSIHRDLSWSGNSPQLRMPPTRERAAEDRYYIYKRPSTLALQFIFSLQAVRDTGSKYKMVMKMDAMVAVGNPNDVPLVVSPGMELDYQLSLVPYDLNWKISKAEGGGDVLTSISEAPVLRLFKGSLEGRGAGRSAGFTLEPGEAAVFGSSNARGHILDLRRGFVPSGGVEVTSWNLGARGLDATDLVDFEFTRIPDENQYGWMQFNAWIGGREARKGWQMDRITLRGGKLSGALIDESLPPVIKPSQALAVSEFRKPKPVLLLSFLQNVEQPTTGQTPDAFPSRPFQLGETPISDRSFNPNTLGEDRHFGQGLVTAESMNYQFKTLAAGKGGRNIYIGGGRQPNVGGSFNVINRRIPVAPPLSLGAFQHAIASGFCGRFNDSAAAVGQDSIPSSAVALCGKPFATPLVSHAVGNSHGVPQLGPDEVYSNRPPGSQLKVATDHSWMVNTALWDSWFLSGVVDGSSGGTSRWMEDGRSARDQFMDLAEGERPLRNKRFLFYPFKTPDEAADELFDGGGLKDSAIYDLPKYLLVDGAFNVNSTSAKAWAAMLTSVRDQELITGGGATRSFDHPFGTLGYAASEATTGIAGDWEGLRNLSEDEITTLAENIVEEVRKRGPFLSMADFVNRRPDSGDSEVQALGALQAAINRSGLNRRQAAGNRAALPSDYSGLPGADLIAGEGEASRAVGSRGYLSQGDLLTALGSQIAVRSDSFVIRSYGDARDGSGNVIARAWCEAVVQRVPEFIDPADEPEAREGWPGRRNRLAAANTEFGRRFVVQSFRWLSPEEV